VATDAGAERSNGCLAAVGVGLAPVLALSELAALREAVAAAGAHRAAAATRTVVIVLILLVPVALSGGWRRGRRPLNRKPVPQRVRGYWIVGVGGAVAMRALSPSNELWLHGLGLVLSTVGTVMFASALASRLAHGALKGRGPDGPVPPD
jgi:hypothetical protein